MALTDEELAELLTKVRDIHASIEAGLVVTIVPEERDAIVTGVTSKIQPNVKSALYNTVLNVPVPAGIGTFSPKPPSGT